MADRTIRLPAASPALAVVLLLASVGLAWGPHTEITAAAQAVLPGRDALQKRFGPHWQRLARDYVWAPDWQEAVRPDHYAEDYLLFPGYPDHRSHMHPEVRRAFGPFFRRALQALRTESPSNAARWLGGLLHFVQDSGSPPHTTGVGGELHGRMERWVDEAGITLGDYRPRLLGKTDDEAERGLLACMTALHDYSKERAIRLRPLVEKLDRRANQPLELECALECARASADVLHTLFTLAGRPADDGGALEGKLAYRPPEGYAAVPAKVILAGTNFSTTTEPDGSYRLRNLPASRYTVWFLATGYEIKTVAEVEIKPGGVTALSPALAPDPVAGNLVRNPRFLLEWVRPGQPDAWGRDRARPWRWASAVVRVPLERSCEVRVEFQPGKTVPVSVRWRSNPASTDGSREVRLTGERDGVLTAEVAPPPLTPFEKGVLYLEVLLDCAGKPGDDVRHVAVRFRPRP